MSMGLNFIGEKISSKVVEPTETVSRSVQRVDTRKPESFVILNYSKTWFYLSNLHTHRETSRTQNRRMIFVAAFQELPSTVDILPQIISLIKYNTE
jgi:hypothetical protein